MEGEGGVFIEDLARKESINIKMWRFGTLLCQFEKRLTGWKKKNLLSKGGRLVLIKRTMVNIST